MRLSIPKHESRFSYKRSNRRYVIPGKQHGERPLELLVGVDLPGQDLGWSSPPTRRIGGSVGGWVDVGAGEKRERTCFTA